MAVAVIFLTLHVACVGWPEFQTEMVAETEGTDLLELELAPGYSAVLQIQLALAVRKSFKMDPKLTLDDEIFCHVEAHYEAGMRALITLVGSSLAS